MRSFGFAKALMRRLSGVHDYVSVVATLYLDGAYQTQSLGQVSVVGGVTDTDLTAELSKDTKQLIAYTVMDTRG